MKANELVKDLSEKTANNISNATVLLNEHIEEIEQSTERTVERCKAISEDLKGNVNLIENIMGDQNKHLLENVKILEQGGDMIRQKLSEHGALVSTEVDRIMTKTKAIEESISMQVRELNGVSEEVYSSMLNAENNITMPVTVARVYLRNSFIIEPFLCAACLLP